MERDLKKELFVADPIDEFLKVSRLNSLTSRKLTKS